MGHTDLTREQAAVQALFQASSSGAEFATLHKADTPIFPVQVERTGHSDREIAWNCRSPHPPAHLTFLPKWAGEFSTVCGTLRSGSIKGTWMPL